MELLLNLGLSNALAASVLAIGVACVARWVRRPALVHCLWLLVLLKLITPPLFSVPVDLPGQLAQEATPLAPSPASETFEMTGDFALTRLTDDPMLTLDPQEPAMTLDMIDSEPTPPAPAIEAAWQLPAWRSVLVGIWATGTLLWVFLAGWRIARFVRLVRQARAAPAEICDRVELLGERLGIAGCPRVGLVPGCVSPMLWALSGRPRLLLPAALWDQLDDDQRDTLLVHELAHLRRRDHWVRNLELVVTGLYWWQPVVWWARGALREAEEECCDAWVVWVLPTSARAYATALLQTVSFLSITRPSLPIAASGLGHVSSLKRRLTMILQEPKPRALSWAGRLAVVGLAGLLLPVAPSWAQREAKDDESVQQQAGRADRDDDNDKDDQDQARERDRDRRSRNDGRGEAGRVRERQLEDARAQVEKLKEQFAARRKEVDAVFEKVRTQLEAQMKESKRALEEADEQLQKAIGRMTELERGEGAARLRGGPGSPMRGPMGPDGRRFGPPRGDGRGDGPPGRDGRFRGLPPAPPDDLEPQRVPPTPAPRGPGRGPGMMLPGGGRGMGPGTDPATQRRLDALERKLDRLLDEVGKLKKPQANLEEGDGETQAESDLTRALDRTIWATRMQKRGYVSEEQVKRELLSLFEQAKARAKVLEQNRSKQQTAEILALQRAKDALEQAKASVKSQDKPEGEQ